MSSPVIRHSKPDSAQDPASDMPDAILGDYLAVHFPVAAAPAPIHLPGAGGASLACWKNYAAFAGEGGIIPVLRDRLPQFRFPVKAGISESPAYIAATRRGEAAADEGHATLHFEHPDQVQLLIYSALAGEIPVLIAADRRDFVTLLRAFTCRNEPDPIPDSMGACMLAGFNNWDRIRQLRREWEERTKPFSPDLQWKKAFKEIVPQKELYQDRLILLSSGSYSAVNASDAGMAAGEWIKRSIAIRLEHECTHFFTRQVFGAMHNHLFDELLADFMGITGATGSYQPAWALRFLGLENFPHYRPGGRLENYCPAGKLSEAGFRQLCRLTYQAISNLADYAGQRTRELSTLPGRAGILFTLCHFNLTGLAEDGAAEKILAREAALHGKLSAGYPQRPSNSAGITYAMLQEAGILPEQNPSPI